MTSPSATDRPAFADYVRQLDSMPGWFSRTDTRCFEVVNRLQHDQGLNGDVLEIGAYMGKSAVALGYFLEGDEHLVICDPFETADLSVYENTIGEGEYDSLTRTAFETNFRRFHATLPEIHQCYSSALGPAIEGRRFRLIHVDGGHRFDEVQDDVDLAIRHLEPGGVIIFDDTQNWRLPGCIAAAWTAVGTGTVRPIFLTQTKLYTTVGDALDASGVRALIAGNGRLQSDESAEIRGHEMLVVKPRFDDQPRSRLKDAAKDWLPPKLTGRRK